MNFIYIVKLEQFYLQAFKSIILYKNYQLNYYTNKISSITLN
jgi:hypothetical protein